MKKLLLLLILAGTAQAADITAGVSTPHGQSYNQSFRDIKDGNNAATRDVVSANSLSQTTAATNAIKTSGGYLDNITINAACSPGTYVIGDAAAAAATYATVLSTLTVTSAGANIPFRGRFSNGLAINTTVSSCTVTASFR
jgi:hypothetical protein